MGRTSINFFVATSLIVASILIVSALATEYDRSNEQELQSCQHSTELCIRYGDYNCCEGQNCVGGDPNLPSGVGVCAPLGQQPQPPRDKCRKIYQLCHPYGQYDCCEGLRCVDTRNLPNVAGVNTQKYNLPPGVGICGAIKL